MSLDKPGMSLDDSNPNESAINEAEIAENNKRIRRLIDSAQQLDEGDEPEEGHRD